MQSTLPAKVYLTERHTPQPGESDYLPLSDLLLVLKEYSTSEQIRLLDFGCGGSPYRGLYPNAVYERADLSGIENIDYVVDENHAIKAASTRFDYILSTQVLEHLRQPRQYLAECRRLLRVGGRLLLSTHGIFREHACPRDYRRWTTEGLQEEVRAAGFSIIQAKKVTVGGRALAYFLETHGWQLFGSRRNLVGSLLWLLNRAICADKRRFHLWCDRCLAASRVVDAADQKHDLYIGLVVSAERQ